MGASRSEEGQGLKPWAQAYSSYGALVFDTNFNDRLPLWLTDGSALLLSNTIVSEKEIGFGSPIPSKVRWSGLRRCVRRRSCSR